MLKIVSAGANFMACTARVSSWSCVLMELCVDFLTELGWSVPPVVGSRSALAVAPVV